MPRPLTSYAECAGCASKLGAAALADILSGLPRTDDDRVVVDFGTGDDAGVYRWSGGRSLVQTVDFFTPIVDDPYAFGQIAAANALSDVYAMGGTPRTALAIATLPRADGPEPEVIRDIFRGGADTLRDAGVALLGGHTVSDPEIKFGYAITGEVEDGRVLTNAGAKPGDVLILTKPLGTGIIVRARQDGRATDEELDAAVRSMRSLNRDAASAARACPAGSVHACTDITGFGLAGHATEMAISSGVALRIEADRLPLLPGVAKLAAAFLPCGGRTNRRDFAGLRVAEGVPPEAHLAVLDPQTSGGLLFAVDPGVASMLLGHLTNRGITGSMIGQVGVAGASGPRVELTGSHTEAG